MDLFDDVGGSSSNWAFGEMNECGGAGGGGAPGYVPQSPALLEQQLSKLKDMGGELQKKLENQNQKIASLNESLRSKQQSIRNDRIPPTSTLIRPMNTLSFGAPAAAADAYSNPFSSISVADSSTDTYSPRQPFMNATALSGFAQPFMPLAPAGPLPPPPPPQSLPRPSPQQFGVQAGKKMAPTSPVSWRREAAAFPAPTSTSTSTTTVNACFLAEPMAKPVVDIRYKQASSSRMSKSRADDFRVIGLILI
jgi:hypothetical protein